MTLYSLQTSKYACDLYIVRRPIILWVHHKIIDNDFFYSQESKIYYKFIIIYIFYSINI